MTLLFWFAVSFGVFYGGFQMVMLFLEWQQPEPLQFSRPVPDIGTRSAAHMPAGTTSGGFPVGSPPVPACSVSGEPPHTRILNQAEADE